jgi:hypothetical protein
VQQAASGIDRRNLRGRCGGSRVWRREPPALRTDEPFRALASSGAGVEVRSGKKGASLSIAKLPPLTGRGGVTRGRLQATNVASARAPVARRVPERVESILIAATALPFAGEAETGI